MQCLILAGGLGTRIRDLAGELPKHLIPVQGRPFADLQLRLLRRHGVTRVIYSIGFRGEQIRAYVGDGSAWGLDRVDWVEDGDTPLGTAGPIRKALDAGLLEPTFLVLYGDSYLPVDYADVLRSLQGPALMTVLKNDDRWDKSNACYADGRVPLYRKGPARPEDPPLDYVDYGLTALTAEAVAELPVGPGALDAWMERLSRAGRLAGYEVRERFYEVGSPAGVADLESFLS